MSESVTEHETKPAPSKGVLSPVDVLVCLLIPPPIMPIFSIVKLFTEPARGATMLGVSLLGIPLWYSIVALIWNAR